MLPGMLQTFGQELGLANGVPHQIPGDFVAPAALFASQQINVDWSDIRERNADGESRPYFEIRTSTIIRQDGRRAVFARSSEPVFLGGLSLKEHNLASIVAAISGYQTAPSLIEGVTKPSEYPVARMLRLNNGSSGVPAERSEPVADLRSPAGIEQALTEVLVERIVTPSTSRKSQARSRHAEIMRRFHAVVATAGGDILPIPEVCAAVDVSQRTLNLCCHDSLGLNPKSYLNLRRMHLARRMLSRPHAFTTTVTETAAHFGFYNFGRFAVQYRLLFGETPSQTLRSSAAPALLWQS